MKYKGGIFDEREGFFSSRHFRSLRPNCFHSSSSSSCSLFLLQFPRFLQLSRNHVDKTTREHSRVCVIVRGGRPSKNTFHPPFFFRKEQLSAAGCNWLLHCCVARCLDRWYTFRTLFVFYFYFPTTFK